AINADGAGVVQVHVCADRMALKPYVPCVFRSQPESEIGIGESVRFFLLAKLQVNPPAAGFNVRKAGALLGSTFSCRRRWHLLNAQQQRLKVPMVARVNKVQAGRSDIIGELEIGDFQPALPQRSQSQIGCDLTAEKQRFRTESRIVHHLKIVKIKSGTREQ